MCNRRLWTICAHTYIFLSQNHCQNQCVEGPSSKTFPLVLKLKTSSLTHRNWGNCSICLFFWFCNIHVTHFRKWLCNTYIHVSLKNDRSWPECTHKEKSYHKTTWAAIFWLLILHIVCRFHHRKWQQGKKTKNKNPPHSRKDISK